MSLSCGVCSKHQDLANLPGGVIFENEVLFIAHFPFAEKAPHYGHLIVELKRHITSPREMTKLEASQVGTWMQALSLFLEAELGAEHTYLFRIGDVTPHLHFHVVPRFANTPRHLWGIYLYENPDSRKASQAEVIALSDQMREYFLRQEA